MTAFVEPAPKLTEGFRLLIACDSVVGADLFELGWTTVDLKWFQLQGIFEISGTQHAIGPTTEIRFTPSGEVWTRMMFTEDGELATTSPDAAFVA